MVKSSLFIIKTYTHQTLSKRRELLDAWLKAKWEKVGKKMLSSRSWTSCYICIAAIVRGEGSNYTKKIKISAPGLHTNKALAPQTQNWLKNFTLLEMFRGELAEILTTGSRGLVVFTSSTVPRIYVRLFILPTAELIAIKLKPIAVQLSNPYEVTQFSNKHWLCLCDIYVIISMS